MTPQLSVIIPVYNAARWLPEAVESVLAQGHPRLEIVVVDDGSTDATADVMARIEGPIVRLHQANQGVAAARNAGLLAASYELVAFLDADDTWPAGSLAARLAALEGPPAVDYAVGLTQLVRAEPPVPHGAPWRSPQLGSALFRRTAFERVGAFDPQLRSGEDVDWFLRAREAQLARAHVDTVTLIYRWHGANLTRGQGAAGRNLPAVLRRALQRRAAREEREP